MSFEQWAGLTTGQWAGYRGTPGRSQDTSAATGSLQEVRLRLERLCRGGMAEWRRLIESYYDKTVDRIFAMVRDHHDARDVGQNVFVRLWQHRSGLRYIGDLESYIMAAARNQALNFRREQGTNRKSVMLLGEMDHLPCKRRSNQISELETRWKADLLQGISELLTSAQKRVFAEIQSEPDASRRAIGSRLGCSHTNIQAIMKRIRRTSETAIQAKWRKRSSSE